MSGISPAIVSIEYNLSSLQAEKLNTALLLRFLQETFFAFLASPQKLAAKVNRANPLDASSVTALQTLLSDLPSTEALKMASDKVLFKNRLIRFTYEDGYARDLPVVTALLALGDIINSFWLSYHAYKLQSAPREESFMSEGIEIFMRHTPQPDQPHRRIISRPQALHAFFEQFDIMSKQDISEFFLSESAIHALLGYRHVFSNTILRQCSLYLTEKLRTNESEALEDLKIFFTRIPSALGETQTFSNEHFRKCLHFPYSNKLHNVNWLQFAILNDRAALLDYLLTESALHPETFNEKPESRTQEQTQTLKDFYAENAALAFINEQTTRTFSSLFLTLFSPQSEKMGQRLVEARFTLSKAEQEELEIARSVYCPDFFNNTIKVTLHNLYKQTHYSIPEEAPLNVEAIHELKSKINTKMESSLTPLKETHRKLKENIEELEGQVKNARNKTQNLKQAIDALRLRVHQYPREVDEKISALRERINTASRETPEKVEKVRMKIQNEKERLRTTQFQLNALKARYQQAQRELEKIKKTLIQNREQHPEIVTDRKQGLKAILDDTQQIRKNSVHDRQQIKKQITQAETKLKQLQTEEKSTRQKIEQLHPALLAQRQKTAVLREQNAELLHPEPLDINLEEVAIAPADLEVTEGYWNFFLKIAEEIKIALTPHYEPHEYCLTLKGSRVNERYQKKKHAPRKDYSLHESTDLDVALFYKPKGKCAPPAFFIQSHFRQNPDFQESSSRDNTVISLSQELFKIDLCCMIEDSISPTLSPVSACASSAESTPLVESSGEASGAEKSDSEKSSEGTIVARQVIKDLAIIPISIFKNHIEHALVPTLAQYFIPPKSGLFNDRGLLIRTQNQKQLVFNITGILSPFSEPILAPVRPELEKCTKGVAYLFWVRLRNKSYCPYRDILDVDLRAYQEIFKRVRDPEYPQITAGVILFVLIYYKRDPAKVHDFLSDHRLLMGFTEPESSCLHYPPKSPAADLPKTAAIYLTLWVQSVRDRNLFNADQEKNLANCLNQAGVSTDFLSKEPAQTAALS